MAPGREYLTANFRKMASRTALVSRGGLSRNCALRAASWSAVRRALAVRVIRKLHRGETLLAEVPQPAPNRVGIEIEYPGDHLHAVAIIKGNQRIRTPYLQRFDLPLAHDIQECLAFVSGQKGGPFAHLRREVVLCSCRWRGA